jgi:hypothetical protein
MDYTQLTESQIKDIRRQKLLEIEAEHARLALDLELAAGVGLANEQVSTGKANLAMLERQHTTLVDLLSPPEPSPNGADAMALRS